MRTLIALAALLATPIASAQEPKPPSRPALCSDFKVLVDQATGKPVMGVCRDTERPVLFCSWAQVSVDGSAYTVGMRCSSGGSKPKARTRKGDA